MIILRILSIWIFTVKCIHYSSLSSQIIYHGRYYVQNQSINYDWSCFKITFCFQNTSKITMHILDTWNIYDVIYNNTIYTIKPGKLTQIDILNLNKTSSGCLDIVKITQNHYGPIGSHKDSKFDGITIDTGKLIKKQQTFKYKFQFLGDSLTTAFGDMSNRKPTCMLKMRKSQNCRNSWASLLSSKLQADFRMVAISGRGLTRNAIGVPGKTMPIQYTRVTSNSADFSYKYEDQYFPDAIFVFIGGNDFANIHPSPKIFVQVYTQMLTLILRQYKYRSTKNPKIICICESSTTSQLCIDTKQAVKQFTYSYLDTFYLQIDTSAFSKNNLGCIEHPNENGHKIIAESLAPQIKKILQK